MSQLVVVIQCDIVTKRCSGYACMNTFANRVDTMADYPADTRFLMMTCGGCCGAGIAAKLENLTRKIKRYGDKKENVTIHFASCVVSDSYHRPPCPFRNYMARIIERKGYPLVLGAYISKATEAKRKKGVYREF